MDEFGDEMAGDVEGDEGLEAADAVSADEGGGGGGVGEWEWEGGDLGVVQFDDGGVDSDGGE